MELNEEKIQQKIEERDKIRDAALKITGTMTPDRVQTSQGGDRIGDAVADYSDLDEMIEQELSVLYQFRHDMINQIQSLSTLKYIKVLYKKYVQFMGIDEIAKDMNYSYQYIVEMHNAALREFEETFKNILNHIA